MMPCCTFDSSVINSIQSEQQVFSHRKGSAVQSTYTGQKLAHSAMRKKIINVIKHNSLLRAMVKWVKHASLLWRCERIGQKVL